MHYFIRLVMLYHCDFSNLTVPLLHVEHQLLSGYFASCCFYYLYLRSAPLVVYFLCPDSPNIFIVFNCWHSHLLKPAVFPESVCFSQLQRSTDFNCSILFWLLIILGSDWYGWKAGRWFVQKQCNLGLVHIQSLLFEFLMLKCILITYCLAAAQFQSLYYRLQGCQ